MTILTTPRFAIPYPQSNEDADPPADFQAMAERMEVLVGQVYDVLVPIGSMKLWPQTAAPTDWIQAAGQSLLRAGTYAALFGIVGTTYGAVDGTHFNLPDLQGRVPVGFGIAAGAAGAINIPIGEKLGERLHVLALAEMAIHNHGVNDPPHTHVASSGQFVVTGPGEAFALIPEGTPGGVDGHATATAGSSTGVTIQNNGGNLPHNNMQPYQAVNYVIRYA